MNRRQSISSGKSGSKSPISPLQRRNSLKNTNPTSINSNEDSLQSVSPTPSPSIPSTSLSFRFKSPISALTPLPFDLFQEISFSSIKADFQDNYFKRTTIQTQLIDIYLLFIVLSGVLVFSYGAFTGAIPYHSFLAAFGATLGSFVFAFNLRLQCDSPRDQAMTGGCAEWERSIAHFLACHFVLFICVANFIA